GRLAPAGLLLRVPTLGGAIPRLLLRVAPLRLVAGGWVVATRLIRHETFPHRVLRCGSQPARRAGTPQVLPGAGRSITGATTRRDRERLDRTLPDPAAPRGHICTARRQRESITGPPTNALRPHPTAGRGADRARSRANQAQRGSTAGPPTQRTTTPDDGGPRSSPASEPAGWQGTLNGGKAPWTAPGTARAPETGLWGARRGHPGARPARVLLSR